MPTITKNKNNTNITLNSSTITNVLQPSTRKYPVPEGDCCP